MSLELSFDALADRVGQTATVFLTPKYVDLGFATSHTGTLTLSDAYPEVLLVDCAPSQPSALIAPTILLAMEGPSGSMVMQWVSHVETGQPDEPDFFEE